ncbi:hypothetical protein [Longimycelium tulufanense]|uniref:hypothetical protein n=1 Tax=Longimycelium tulufanense TaxID=907463 RepID=UPI001E5EE5A9|nr:hypothetical protein [Longimycelium tulufanense]
MRERWDADVAAGLARPRVVNGPVVPVPDRGLAVPAAASIVALILTRIRQIFFAPIILSVIVGGRSRRNQSPPDRR